MNASQVIVLARKHVGNGAAMDSSARMCLADAVSLFDKENHEAAKRRAVDALRYSVGIFHADYKKAVS